MGIRRILLAAALEVRDVARGATPTHHHLRDRLVAVALFTVAVDLVCAVLALLLERHAPQTEVKSFGSALFWTSTQLLTVSSQFKNPITTGGRVLDVFMEAYAITVVATLAGSFGSFLHRRSSERQAELRGHGSL
ncbi:MAG: hypothetical protein JWO74_4280 [Solirubrobacterales bacterium]|nr:hypothetical protein [Solirubrobacterales bacterium]